MEQNISLYISEYTSAKTELLKNIIKQAQSDNKVVITNMAEFNQEYDTDIMKKDIIKENQRCIFKTLSDDSLDSTYREYLSSIMRLLYAKGDVLVLDKIDMHLKNQDIVDLSAAISDTRHLWDAVIISGNSNYFTRLFTNIDRESYVSTYVSNIWYVDSNMELTNVTEDEECDCFDIIEYISLLNDEIERRFPHTIQVIISNEDCIKDVVIELRENDYKMKYKPYEMLNSPCVKYDDKILELCADWEKIRLNNKNTLL